MRSYGDLNAARVKELRMDLFLGKLEQVATDWTTYVQIGFGIALGIVLGRVVPRFAGLLWAATFTHMIASSVSRRIEADQLMAQGLRSGSDSLVLAGAMMWAETACLDAVHLASLCFGIGATRLFPKLPQPAFRQSGTIKVINLAKLRSSPPEDQGTGIPWQVTSISTGLNGGLQTVGTTRIVYVNTPTSTVVSSTAVSRVMTDVQVQPPIGWVPPQPLKAPSGFERIPQILPGIFSYGLNLPSADSKADRTPREAPSAYSGLIKEPFGTEPSIMVVGGPNKGSRKKTRRSRPEPNVVKLDMSDIKKVSSPDILHSGGLSFCIAVGVYDPVSKRGYMGHFFHSLNLEDLIEVIQADDVDFSRLKIFVTGNSPDSTNEPGQAAYELKIRSRIQKILARHFHDSQITIKWGENDSVTTLLLDTKSGTFTVESEKDADLAEELRKILGS